MSKQTLPDTGGSILKKFSNLFKASGSDLSPILKSSVPNLDPNFFKAPWSIAQNDEVITDPYGNNVWVYAACTAIATNLIGLPKALDLTGTEEQELKTDHPILELFKNPNPLMSASAFWEAIILNLLLPTSSTKGGQCFLIMEDGKGSPASLSRGDIPKEIYPFSDALIKPIISKEDKSLEGWLLHGANGEKIPYTTDEVIRIYLYDPANPLKGQCPLWAARSGVRQDAKASAVNENFFKNNASLGGALSTDAELDDDTVKKLRHQWHDTYSGPTEVGKTAVLHKGLKFEQFQRTHVDMQYMEQKKFSRDEIMAVYRVPKAEISIYEDINFATAESANKSFWQKTVIPHDNRILEALNSQWIQYVEKGKYELVSDLTKVEALQENYTEKLDQAKKLAELKVPVEEINRRLDLNLSIDKYSWLKTSLVNYSLAPAEDVMEKDNFEDDNTGEGTEEDTTKDVPVTIEDSTDKFCKAIDEVHAKAEERTKVADAYAKKVLDPDEKSMKRVINKFFIGQRNRYQDLVDKWVKSKKSMVTKIEEAPPISFFNLDPKKEAVSLRKMLLPEYKKQIANEAVQMESELGPLVKWDEKSPGINKALKKRLKAIKGINNTSNIRVANALKASLEKAVEDNLSVPQTAKLLKEGIRGVYNKPFRAKTIARTETGIIHSEARFDIMKTEGVEEIEWLTARDELVRSASNSDFPHDILDGEQTKTGTPFNNGEEIRYPHDQNASAGNVINCRCTFRVVRK